MGGITVRQQGTGHGYANGQTVGYYYVDGRLEKDMRASGPGAPIWDGPDTKLVIGNMSRLR